MAQQFDYETRSQIAGIVPVLEDFKKTFKGGAEGYTDVSEASGVPKLLKNSENLQEQSVNMDKSTDQVIECVEKYLRQYDALESVTG